jgi:hypothetical protein
MSGTKQRSIPANHLFLYTSVLYFIHIPRPLPHSCLFPCLFDMPASSMLGHKNLHPNRSSWFESIILLRPWQYNPSLPASFFHCFRVLSDDAEMAMLSAIQNLRKDVIFPSFVTESSLKIECFSKWSRYSLIAHAQSSSPCSKLPLLSRIFCQFRVGRNSEMNLETSYSTSWISLSQILSFT